MKSCSIGGLQEITPRTALHIVAIADKDSKMSDRQGSYSVNLMDDWWDSNRLSRSIPSCEGPIDKYQLLPTSADKYIAGSIAPRPAQF